MRPEIVDRRRKRATWAVVLEPEDGVTYNLRRSIASIIIDGRYLEVKRKLRNGTLICREAA